MQPELSLVLPCYNEAAALPVTIPELAAIFLDRGVAVELVLVDNGSTDETGQVIDQLIVAGLPVRKCRVEVNRGKGAGLQAGLKAATGRLVGWVDADGQVAPADVLRVYEAAAAADGPVLAKARRHDRTEGFSRSFVTLAFNLAANVLFPGIESLDINASPKIFPRDLLGRLALDSTRWSLDFEIMAKLRRLGVPVVEVDVVSRPRQAGHSHVNRSAAWELLGEMIRMRLGR